MYKSREYDSIKKDQIIKDYLKTGCTCAVLSKRYNVKVGAVSWIVSQHLKEMMLYNKFVKNSMHSDVSGIEINDDVYYIYDYNFKLIKQFDYLKHASTFLFNKKQQNNHKILKLLDKRILYNGFYLKTVKITTT